MPTPKQYADALSATPRNSWKYLADAMQPVSEFADTFKVKQDVPLVGGMSAADFTGLKGAFGLADDASYGKYPIRGASLQTAKVDPRVIDAMGLAGALMPVAKNVGKAALREGARQIETGTGIGRAALDPRMEIVPDLKQMSSKWESQGIKNDVYENGNKITLSRITVPKESRNSGIGSNYMQELLDYADASGKRVELSPSADFGGNKNRLKEFYSRFGFIENKGKNKDFSTMQSMYREPIQSVPKFPKTDGEIRSEIAQRNAALPISEGGLGLPANNMPMDRARAIGWDTPAYHGTNDDIYEFDPMLGDIRRGTGTPVGSVVVSSSPDSASTYAGEIPAEWVKKYHEGGNVMPLLINKKQNLSMNASMDNYTPNWNEIYNKKYPDIKSTNDFAALAMKKGMRSATIKNVKDNAVMAGHEGDTTFLFNPSDIRSRFAAFDPFRRHEADILAGVGVGGMLDPESVSEEFRKKERK